MASKIETKTDIISEKRIRGRDYINADDEYGVFSTDTSRKQLESGASLVRLTAGTMLGPYTIDAAIGAGGMGEVYRAQDTRLGRTVAIKVLPADRMSDPDRRRRFLQEARAASALNHPNIITLYDIANDGDVDFLVMEYVQGKPLDIVTGGAGLPLDQTLAYAIQIGQALDAAHNASVIHRDIKPANVLVTDHGRIKVLDFGLAKLAAASVSTSSGTTLIEATQPGLIMGTLGYMSPEQARGEPLDHRTDLFAFGAVLYQMATGRAPFPRSFDWTLPSTEGVPVPLRPVIAKLLEPDRGLRYQSAADVIADLKRLQRSGESTLTSRRAWVAAAFALALALVASAVIIVERRSAGPVGRNEWVQLTNFPDSVSQPVLSPDGRMLAFVRGPGTFQTEGQIYVKLLPDGEPKQLTQDNFRKMSPMFSPDGSQVAYTTISNQNAWDTWLVPVLGGTPTRWIPNASGLVWIDQRRLLFSEIKSGMHMGIVSAEPTRAAQRDVYLPSHERAMAHRSYPSPDRQSALIVEMDGRSAWTRCRVVPLDGSSDGVLVGPPGGCTSAGWSPDGKFIYTSSNTGDAFHIWRQRFPNGSPEQVTSGPTDEEGIAIASDGRSLVTAVGLKQRSIMFHEGGSDRQISLEGYAFSPVISRDGRRLYYLLFKTGTALVGSSELWVRELDSGRSELLYQNVANPGETGGSGGGSFDISPDGRQIVLAAMTDNKARLWLLPTDRSAAPRQIPNVEGQQPRFGAPGEILFRSDQADQRFIYRVREDGSELKKALPTPAEFEGVFLNGDWLAAWSFGVGTHVYPLKGGPPIRVWGRDMRLRWSSDGRFLFMSFANTAGTLYAAGRTYVIPLSAGRVLPDIPAGGFQSEAEIAKLPGVQLIDAADVAPGPTAGVYAFSRETTQRNLYRVPLR